MTLTHFNTRPMPDNGLRKKKAQDVSKEIGKVADRRPARTVLSNEEEIAFPLTQPTNFTKGLKHDEYGFVSRVDYEGFVASLVQSQQSMASAPINGSGSRKWESPLAGHYFETEGPDPGALAMAPAPKLGSSELCSEMAVLYAMALVRDIAFSDLAKPSTLIGQTYPDGHPKEGTEATVQDLVDELRKLSWMDPNKSTYGYNGKLDGLNAHEMRRRASLWEDPSKGLTVQSLFRGSTYGAKQGPLLSQFLLLGTGNKADAMRDPLDGLISYGAQTIDQRVEQATEGADYMTTWEDWLTIQNGSDVNDPVDKNQWENANRLITTPRDLATYVHFDQLYQAYLNATIILEGYRKKPGEVATDSGNPIAAFRQDKVDGFATWGGPHILSLVTEVATRALRAVRRQKFLIHRRARPEVLAARLTQVHNDQVGGMDAAAITKIESMLRELGADDPADENRPGVLLHWISALNAERNGGAATFIAEKQISGGNFLLPMAFPEGSPMHAAYGAGHATVAGACVTMMKAFYDKDLTMKQVHGFTNFYQTDAHGGMMEAEAMDSGVLVSHELDKLAANISIGRNHAGVHYHTDYYDSLRLGERVAVGILEEQMLAYNEEVTLSFTGFDGEEIALKTDGSGTAAGVTMTVDGAADANWWTRNVQDFQLAPEPALLA